MTDKLFDDDEMQEKKVKVQDIEKSSGLPIPDLDISIPSFGSPEIFARSRFSAREMVFIVVEFILLVYLALGYAGRVPLF